MLPLHPRPSTGKARPWRSMTNPNQSEVNRTNPSHFAGEWRLIMDKSMNAHKERGSELGPPAEVLAAVIGFDTIIGRSAAIRSAVEMARRFALLDSAVLILGETGTGKEIFAR